MEKAGTRWRLVYAGVMLFFALLVALYFVYHIQVVVLVFLLTLLFSIIVSGPVDWIERRGVGRAWGTLLVLGGLTLVLAFAARELAPVVAGQARQLATAFPTVLQDAEGITRRAQAALGLEPSFDLRAERLLEQGRSFLSGGAFSTVASVGASVANVLSLVAVILISTIYMVARPRPLVEGFVAFFPAGRRPGVRKVLRRMYGAVQRWFLGQLADMALVGVLSTLALYLIGIPFALLLGILTGLLCFVPLLGPVFSVFPPLLLALASGEPAKALWVVAAYVVIQSIEGNVIEPMVMSRATALHPVVIVFALLVAGTLFGFIGLLLAVPFVAALHVLLRELWTRKMDEEGVDPEASHERVKEEGEPSLRREVGRLRQALAARLRRP